MRFIILGGGCYGSFYARQLLRARDADALDVREIVVVDHAREPQARRELAGRPGLRFEVEGWQEFLARYIPSLVHDATDWLVTPPFTPHLALAWLLDQVRSMRSDRMWTLEPFDRFPGTPFERQEQGGPLLVSHADWVCPVHCIEPETCPATGGSRHWDLDRTIRDFATDLAAAGQPIDQLHLFHCHHIAYGVGGYRAAVVARSLEAILTHVGTATGGDVARFLVGTISHCHGALHLLESHRGMISEAEPGEIRHGSATPMRAADGADQDDPDR